jgi:hypothetical protein
VQAVNIGGGYGSPVLVDDGDTAPGKVGHPLTPPS